MRLRIERMGQELDVEVNEADLIRFEEGILGFEAIKEYAQLSDADSGLVWLHATGDERIAFPVIDPFLVWPEYDITIPDGDREALQLSEPGEARLLVIVTPQEDPTEITANLRAPLVINRALRVGRQVVLEEPAPPLHAAILPALGDRNAERERAETQPSRPVKKAAAKNRAA